MTTLKRNDVVQYIIGALVLGFIAWQAIGYLLPDKQPTYTGETFMNAISERSGGTAKWNAIQKISFSKEFKLLDSTGGIEIDRKEVHSYALGKNTERLIQWRSQETLYNLVQKNDVLYQTKSGHVDSTATQQALHNKLNAATFVLGLPYTLKDATLRYQGLQSFEGTKAHELKASFKNSEDVWFLYYSEDELNWLGYWVQTSDHYSLVVNETMTVVEGFTLSRKRKSYRTNAKKEKLYLRATYNYDNYKITP